MIKESIIFNELIHDNSPYLLQYIDNPVQWNKWNDETFDKAKTENKPVFVLMGEFLCKKSYQMKRECFLDIEIATILNENFVSINVDREENPIIYAVYREICKAINKDIELPYIMIMTYDKQVFFAESSLPKLEQEDKVGLLDVLNRISSKWNEDKEQFINLAREITVSVKENVKTYEKRAQLSRKPINKAIHIYKFFFRRWQVNNMNKFIKIPPQNIMFLIAYYKHTNDNEIIKILKSVTQNLYNSSVYDHIGGGFFEYTESTLMKTLYTNALMAIVYMEMFEVTKEDKYKMIAKNILEYVIVEFASTDSGFFSKCGGNTKGKEDEYYKFFPFEITKVLGDIKGDEFNKIFNLTRDEDGYLQELPSISNIEIPIRNHEEKIRKILDYRQKRSKLTKDERIFTTENALFLVALAKAYVILKDEKYLDISKKTLRFIEDNLIDVHKKIYINNQSKKEGTLNEYSYVAVSYLALYKATYKKEYLDKAYIFTKKMVDIFGKKDEPGLYLSSTNYQIFNIKIYKDDERLSGNSIATYVFYEIGTILKDVDLVELSKKQLQNIMDNIYEEPLKCSIYLFLLCNLCLIGE